MNFSGKYISSCQEEQRLVEDYCLIGNSAFEMINDYQELIQDIYPDYDLNMTKIDLMDCNIY